MNSSKIYNIGWGPKYDLIASWLGNNKKILDVGCGTGAFAERLSENGNYVVGVESSEENYKVASSKLKVYSGDFVNIEIKEQYDIVLFADVLEHMYNPDQALNKARGLANEIILCVPNFDFCGVKMLKLIGIKKMESGILDKNHIYHFNKKKIEFMIKNTGLNIVDFASPAPKKFPNFYNYLIRIDYDVFGYQFIYRCRHDNS